MACHTVSRRTWKTHFDSDPGRIVYDFRQWRCEPAPDWWDEAEHGKREYRDIPGFCKAETIARIGKHGFVLTPGRYVGAKEQEDDGGPLAVVREKLEGVQTYLRTTWRSTGHVIECRVGMTDWPAAKVELERIGIDEI